jgi:hypothetical protein
MSYDSFGNPLAAPDDAYSANLQRYLAEQNALPRDVGGLASLPTQAFAADGSGGVPDPVATPAVKKAVKKLKKAISAADYPEVSAVRNAVAPAVVPVPLDEAGKPINPAIAGSVAGIMRQGNASRGMTYPSLSSMVPDFIRNIFRSSVDQNVNAARNKEWGSASGWTPENKVGPLSNRSRIPLP